MEGPAQNAESLLKAINEGAGSARTLFVTLMVLALYIFIVVSGTNDEMLLRDSTIAVPTLSNATVPASAFYALAPWVFLFLHLDLLIHFLLLAGKLRRFNEELAQLPAGNTRDDFRVRLAGFPFANWLGSDPRSAGTVLTLQGFIVWLTIALLPIAVLCYLQLGFLPYHSEGITWGHRLAVLIDVGLLLYFWPRMRASRWHGESDSSFWRELWQAIQPELPAACQSGAGVLAWYRNAIARLPRLLLFVLTAIPTCLFSTPNAMDQLRVRLASPPSARDITPFVEAAVSLPAFGALGAFWVWQRIGLLVLGIPALLVAWVLATVPGGQYEARIQSWLGLQTLDGEAFAPPPPFMQITYPQGQVPEALSATCQAQECMQFLGRWIPWSAKHSSDPKAWKESNRLPEKLQASCLQIALFHLKDSPFHRNLVVRDRVLAKSDVKPELAAIIRKTLQIENEADPSSENRIKAERDHRDAVFQIIPLDLSDRDLRYGDFDGASFPGVRLTNSDMQAASCFKCDLRRADLKGVRARRALLSGANMIGATFGEANLLRASLDSANLSGATFEGSILNFAWLSDANLTGASLGGSQLSGAVLDGATLTSAVLKGANLTGANLRHAKLDAAYLDAADLMGALLLKADLRGSSILGSNFTGADLGHADFRGALIGGTSFIGTFLPSANMSGAFFSGGDISGSVWPSAKFQQAMLIFDAPIDAAVAPNVSEYFKAVAKATDVPEDRVEQFLKRTMRNPRTSGFAPENCLGILPTCTANLDAESNIARAYTMTLARLACPREKTPFIADTHPEMVRFLENHADPQRLEGDVVRQKLALALAPEAVRQLRQLARGRCSARLRDYISERYRLEEPKQ